MGNNILNTYSEWSLQTRTVAANLLSKSPMVARTNLYRGSSDTH